LGDILLEVLSVLLIILCAVGETLLNSQLCLVEQSKWLEDSATFCGQVIDNISVRLDEDVEVEATGSKKYQKDNKEGICFQAKFV
jgi:hypothetical protein